MSSNPQWKLFQPPDSHSPSLHEILDLQHSNMQPKPGYRNGKLPQILCNVQHLNLAICLNKVSYAILNFDSKVKLQEQEVAWNSIFFWKLSINSDLFWGLSFLTKYYNRLNSEFLTDIYNFYL